MNASQPIATIKPVQLYNPYIPSQNIVIGSIVILMLAGFCSAANRNDLAMLVLISALTIAFYVYRNEVKVSKNHNNFLRQLEVENTKYCNELMKTDESSLKLSKT